MMIICNIVQILNTYVDKIECLLVSLIEQQLLIFS